MEKTIPEQYELYHGTVIRTHKRPKDVSYHNEELYVNYVDCGRWLGHVTDEDEVSTVLVNSRFELPVGYDITIVCNLEKPHSVGFEGEVLEYTCPKCGTLTKYLGGLSVCPECFTRVYKEKEDGN